MKETIITALFKELYQKLENIKLTLYLVQLGVSFLAFGVTVWHFVTLIRRHYLKGVDFHVNQWVDMFFHPVESNITNYIAISLTLFISSIILYLKLDSKNVTLLKRKVEKIDVKYILVLTLISIAFLYNKRIYVKTDGLFATIPITLVPVLEFSSYIFSIKFVNKIVYLCILLLLVSVSLESINVIRGPIYLLNEYDIPSETFLGNKCVNNYDYVRNLPQKPFHQVNIESVISNRCKALSYNKVTFNTIFSNAPAKIKQVKFDDQLEHADDPEIIDFYIFNMIEYSHFNMSRGPINHIGTILNPAGAIELGKDVNLNYVQYGIGNTYIFKWLMNVFGGISIENYYKCYVIYILYSILFCLMLVYIFKDPLYVLAGLAVFAYAYFYQSYIPFIFAPGILPSIHLMDTIAITLFLAYLRNIKARYLILSFISALIAVLINRQFGFALLISLISAVVAFNFEAGYRKIWNWVLPFIAFLISLALFKITSVGMNGHTMKYMFLGLFSWAAESQNIQICLIFVVISYIFLIWSKKLNNILKYASIFVFAYTQCLLLYFFWSGLSNHLPMVLPFIGVQVLLMINMIHQRIKIRSEKASCKYSFVLSLVILILLVGVYKQARSFYKEKSQYMNNFATHKLYHWNFTRAHLITTINPSVITENIDLIKKYSNDNKGVYIISRYDNILPFMAECYSLMPCYDAWWHILTYDDLDESINMIKGAKPKYLFVDSDILDNNNDEWEKLFTEKFQKSERLSRFGRLNELRNIFNGVINYYDIVERGSLISVYKLKQ